MSDVRRTLCEPLAAPHHPVTVRPQWQFEPCGDRCVILVFGSIFSIDLNRQAAAAGSRLRALAAQGLLPGITDIVSAMVTVGVHYSPEQVASLDPDAVPYEWVCRLLNQWLKDPQHANLSTGNQIEIPVCYEPAYGPDLEEVAQVCGITVEQVIAAHTADWLDVLMVGFAPGHPYIGMLGDALALPRRATPRTRVPQGSVGVANQQSVIYPADLPGGWNLIGRTPLPVFSATSEPPCLLKGGDQVRFVPISARAFEQLARETAQ